MILENYEIIRGSDGICEGANFNGQFTHRYYAVGKKLRTAGNMTKYAVVEYRMNPDWDEPDISHISEFTSEEEANEEFDEIVGGNNEFYFCKYA
jgi:hypothetical protein